ncbi:MAG: ABC-F family ATP-binding cassette domain-containing protein [Clostridia bacterium]|nr:ABC-F family ATP-binding cassette domain-containing protein [Clostridia bacterium]
MLQVKNLTITHSKDLRVLLSGFSFVLNDGDKAVVIGEEGDGKSTLLKLIYDEKLVSGYAQWQGEIAKGRQRLGYLAQELPEEDGNKPVYAYISDADGFDDTTPGELARIEAELGLSGGDLYSDRVINSFSGGEKVKLRIARLLIERPDALLLDEPSNDLDIETLEWLEKFISGCDRPIMFVSHDETLIERTANVVVHIELLRKKSLPRYTVARMPYRQYVSERLSGFTKQEQLARKEHDEFAKQMERYRSIEAKVERDQAAISRQDPHGGQLLKKKMHAVKSMGKRFEREREEITEYPDAEDAIFVKFPESASVPAGKTVVDFGPAVLKIGDKVLAENVSLFVRGPEKICIIGRNGAGKTTLLREIAESLMPRGDIKAAYMPQAYEELLDMDATPVGFLARKGGKEEETRVRQFLGSVRYTPEEMAHPVSEMSGGQKAKLLFLKMVLDGSNVLILDEPTRNFSPMSNPVIRDVLSSFGGAIISVSHDRKYISEVCDKTYRLTENGLFETRI